MSIIRRKLAKVRIAKSDQEANLHVLQRLSSESALDKKLLQHAPSLTLTQIEDRARKNHRKLEESRNAVDSTVYVLIATGGTGNFATPGHQGDCDGSEKGGTGQQQRQGQGWGGGYKKKVWPKHDLRAYGDGSGSSGGGGDDGNSGGGGGRRRGSGNGGGRGGGGGGGGHHAWSHVRNACFVGPEGHLPGIDRLHNAVGYPPNLRPPQGNEKATHGADPRPRCFRCGQVGHFMNKCNTAITLNEDPNPRRHVYINNSHVATSATPLLANLALTPQ